MGESAPNGVRERYLRFTDDWQAGERHLAYTLFAVTAILMLGAIVVPLTLSANEPLPSSQRVLLAERYVEAIAKVKDSTEPVPSVEQAAQTFGVSGGKSCSEPLPKLHLSFVVHPKGGGRSFVDPVAVERLRVAMRVYCPARDARYGTWLDARTAARR